MNSSAPTKTVRPGLWVVLASQFLSTFADNAVLFSAIALLKTGGSPNFHIPYLQESFVAAFICLAPFVGPFADAWPKGRVLTFGTAIKLIGALMLFAHGNPFFCYGAIGVGAAIVSPAKSGILGDLCAPSWLVKAIACPETSRMIRFGTSSRITSANSAAPCSCWRRRVGSLSGAA